ncbi:hypothetical protein ACKI1I_16635 [Streptomyces turgidiscabies]|uniref:Secreted protein n=1 Tax=Streptomyces turgidiscabies (strain Car8) TaxID=698760 RepID=L7EXW5_STRT8|nr:MULTISPECIES: hypothetical protein [Streptomyces]ELP63704.1 hypothetical protein STRTUCAR8_08444 [Streptomyces turgidiscabies Car8]MDX3495046.1 hypothetical protein [Streptomyces turgidiscabies]GAQ70917.1 hypothetical protein T45_02659 [Streptomyces turgidiscabies]
MKHRGRHRRQRRGRALRGALAGTALALTAAATIVSASQAVSSDNPGPLKSLTSAAELKDFQLKEHLASKSSLDRLATSMGGTVGVSTVLEHTNRTMRAADECAPTETEALPVAPTATRAYCWDEADAASRRWLPQSVTTSGDADEDGRWGANRVILSGWTHNDAKPDEPEVSRGLARVAVIDANDLSDMTYRWVLLVVPTEDGSNYRKLESSISGMVWYQDKLLVTASAADTDRKSLYVYDMNRIQRASVSSPAVGRVSGGWSAHGYGYVMPAVASYSLTGGACDPAADDGAPCFGSLSLDRSSTPDSLVASEWFPADADQRSRLWRYSFSRAGDRSGLLAANAFGRVNAVEAFSTKATGIQGVLSYRSAGEEKADWYVGRAPGSKDRHGTLWRLDDDGAKAARCGSDDESRRCWGEHAESLSYWEGTGEVWSLTERAADNRSGTPVPERVLYAVPLSEIADSLR